MRISDWSSDVCSSDLHGHAQGRPLRAAERARRRRPRAGADAGGLHAGQARRGGAGLVPKSRLGGLAAGVLSRDPRRASPGCVIPRRGRGGGTGRGRPRRLKPRPRPRHNHAMPAPPVELPLPVPDAPPFVAGVDEAGRGPLAGPVVVAAVVFAPGRTPVNGLDDSKQLTAARREALYARIVERALAWKIVFVEVEEIDRVNIFQATMLGMRRALEGVLPALATQP